MVKIEIIKDISLREISLLKQRAVRTPHVGSESLHGLVHEQLSGSSSETGIVNLYYDRTTAADIYHHPSYIIVGGKKIKIATAKKNGEDVLSTHLPIDCHMFRLDLIYPDRGRKNYSEFIAENMLEYSEMVQSLGRIVFKKDLWTRYVNNNGIVLNIKPDSYEQIWQDGVFQISDNKKGWIMPNILNIISMFYIDDKKFRSGVVHQISGAEMYKYIKALDSDIQELWKILVKERGSSENLLVKMYPTGNARFASFKQADFYKLSLFLEKVKELECFNLEKAKYFKSVKGKPEKEDLEKINKMGARINTEVEDLAFEIRGILYAMSDAKFVSQYDMEPGQKIYIHDFCLDSSIKELDDMIDFIKKLIKRRKKRHSENF